MPLRLTGKVFNDISHLSIDSSVDNGLSNVFILLHTPDTSYQLCQTDTSGMYFFDIVDTPGEYHLYEIVVKSEIASILPITMPQPIGFTGSTTPRHYILHINEEQLSTCTTVSDLDFGHDITTPFENTTTAYMLSTTSLYALDVVTGHSTLLAPLSRQGNYYAMGFNIIDKHLYGYDQKSKLVFRLDAKGTLCFYSIVGLPSKIFTVGDICRNGKLYLYESLDDYFYVIDVNPFSPSYMELIREAIHPLSPLDLCTWSFNPTDQLLYAIIRDGTIISINPSNGFVKNLPTLGTPLDSSLCSFFDYNGYFYTLFKRNKSIYRITLSAQKALGECFAPFNDLDLTCATRCKDTPLYLTFGSAAKSYPTSLAKNGPRHGRSSLLFISNHPKESTIDTAYIALFEHQTYNLPPLNLTDDVYTFSIGVVNNTDKYAYLYGWLDFNGNGIFEGYEALEPLLISSHSNAVQPVELKFDIPKTPYIRLGETGLRLRLTSDLLENLNTNLDAVDTRSLGPASDGDILDCVLLIDALPPVCTESLIHTLEMNKTTEGICSAHDPANGILTYAVMQNPLHGISTVDSSTGKWHYTPFIDYVGDDTFTLCAHSSISDLSCILTITLNVVWANFTIHTIVNKKEAKLNDILVYTTTIENTGTLTAKNLVLTSALPTGLSFIAHSVLINGIKDLSSVPEYGINLTELHPHEVCTLSFELYINSSLKPIVETQCFVEGLYSLSANEPPIPFSNSGNKVITSLKMPTLLITFTSNTDEVFIGDTVQHCATLTNTGDLPLQNILVNAVLPVSLCYLNDLTLNRTPSPANICTGHCIDELLPSQSLSLCFKTTLIHMPENGLVECTILVSYNYMLNNMLETFTNLSSTTTLTVCSPKIEFSKIASKNALCIGEVFTYTLSAANLGTIPIEEVIFKDIFSSDFEILQISYGSTLFPNTLSLGLSLGSLAAKTTLDLVIKLKVVNLPPSKQLPNNTASGSFKLKLSQHLPLKTLYLEAMDPIGIMITDAELTLEKDVSSSEACLNEHVTYIIKATNTGTVELKDITIFDQLTPEIKFVIGSVIFNGKPLNEASIVSGIILPPLAPKDSYTLTFDALILAKGSKLLENTCSAHYTYTPYASTSCKMGSAISPKCLLTIREPHLSSSGHIAQELAFLGDTLDYHICFTNDGDMDLFNVLLSYQCVSGQLKDGTFTINGHIINSVDLSMPIHLGSIPIHKTLDVTYSLKVSEDYHATHTLANILSAHFSYTTINHCMKMGNSETLTLTIPLAISTFKQFSLENYLDLTCDKPDLEMINSVDGQINLLSYYVIQTPKGTSDEGQRLSGQKLIIHALLNLTVEYVADDTSHSVHSAQYSVPFSTFIVLPPKCPTHTAMSLDTTVDAIAFQPINNRTFFTHSTLMVLARIK